VVRLNGRETTRFTADPGENTRGLPKREDADSGFLGIQVHTGSLAFANIRIKALSPDLQMQATIGPGRPPDRSGARTRGTGHARQG
jgi:hypothetical protein